MAEKLYSSFRLYITKRLGGNAGFHAITELKLFSQKNGLGVDILTGGTATASSNFNSSSDFAASNAFDGNIATRWASVSTAAAQWIRYDLPSLVSKPKSIFIMLNNSELNAPHDFILQGSSDNGATWQNLYITVGFATASEYTAGKTRNIINLGLGGKATIDSSGLPAKRVLLLNWHSLELLYSITPEPNGSWYKVINEIHFDTSFLVVITASVNDNAVRPQAHGPILAGEIEL